VELLRLVENGPAESPLPHHPSLSIAAKDAHGNAGTAAGEVCLAVARTKALQETRTATANRSKTEVSVDGFPETCLSLR
jgi:hypothetical protein